MQFHPHLGAPLTRFVAPSGAPPKSPTAMFACAPDSHISPFRRTPHTVRGPIRGSTEGPSDNVRMWCPSPSSISPALRYSQLHMVGSFAKLICFLTPRPHHGLIVPHPSFSLLFPFILRRSALNLSAFLSISRTCARAQPESRTEETGEWRTRRHD